MYHNVNVEDFIDGFTISWWLFVFSYCIHVQCSTVIVLVFYVTHVRKAMEHEGTGEKSPYLCVEDAPCDQVVTIWASQGTCWVIRVYSTMGVLRLYRDVCGMVMNPVITATPIRWLQGRFEHWQKSKRKFWWCSCTITKQTGDNRECEGAPAWIVMLFIWMLMVW
jgi:hypothetical protein